MRGNSHVRYGVGENSEITSKSYLSLKEFAICSDSYIVANPKYLRKSEKRLKKLQKDLARKQKGSNNRNKARLKVAKLHEKITNQRKDFLHKLSTKLIRENQSIAIEDLRVSSMMKNHKLAKVIGMNLEQC